MLLTNRPLGLERITGCSACLDVPANTLSALLQRVLDSVLVSLSHGLLEPEKPTKDVQILDSLGILRLRTYCARTDVKSLMVTNDARILLSFWCLLARRLRQL